MKPAFLLLCLAVLGTPLAHAAPPGSSDPDWGGVRRDVDAESRRPGSNGEFEARRQAIRERARARYNEADVNRDGQLSREEMARLRPGMARHFDRIDANGDGLASEREIVDALRQRQHMRREGLNRQ